MVERTKSGLLMGASETQYTPPENLPRKPAATCRARRVLPIPPGPVRVRRRVWPDWRSEETLDISRSRPTMEVRGRGIAVGLDVDVSSSLSPRSLAPLLFVE